MTNIQLKKASVEQVDAIWDILSQSIERRRQDGSTQWQDGYPNRETIKKDIEQGYGYTLTENDALAGYAAVIKNNEPSYNTIDGKWLSEGDFLVVHRVAVSNDFLGKGYAQRIFTEVEELAKEHHTRSIKVDTNYDNHAMLRILEKLGYTYCGEIRLVRNGETRKAFEKLI